jgi:hypothetical protein
MTDANSLFDFNDADLSAALARTVRDIAILAVVLFVVLLFTAGWQTGMLLLAGALVSGSGVYEYKRLISAINARLDGQKRTTPTLFAVSMFLLRLFVAAAVIYGSLKCFHGSIYALIGGLGLAVVALSFEAVRLLKS